MVDRTVPRHHDGRDSPETPPWVGESRDTTVGGRILRHHHRRDSPQIEGSDEGLVKVRKLNLLSGNLLNLVMMVDVLRVDSGG
jgi:hypothetical protein